MDGLPGICCQQTVCTAVPAQQQHPNTQQQQQPCHQSDGLPFSSIDGNNTNGTSGDSEKKKKKPWHSQPKQQQPQHIKPVIRATGLKEPDVVYCMAGGSRSSWFICALVLLVIGVAVCVSSGNSPGNTTLLSAPLVQATVAAGRLPVLVSYAAYPVYRIHLQPVTTAAALPAAVIFLLLLLGCACISYAFWQCTVNRVCPAGSRYQSWLDTWLANRQQFDATTAGVSKRGIHRGCMAHQAASFKIQADIGDALANLWSHVGITVGVGVGAGLYCAILGVSQVWERAVLVVACVMYLAISCCSARGMPGNASQLLGMINAWSAVRGKHLCLMQMHHATVALWHNQHHTRGALARKRIMSRVGKALPHHQPKAMAQVLVELLHDTAMQLTVSFCCRLCGGICASFMVTYGMLCLQALVLLHGCVVGVGFIASDILACTTLISGVMGNAIAGCKLAFVNMGSLHALHIRHFLRCRLLGLIVVLMLACMLPRGVEAGHATSSTPGSVANAAATVATTAAAAGAFFVARKRKFLVTNTGTIKGPAQPTAVKGVDAQGCDAVTQTGVGTACEALASASATDTASIAVSKDHHGAVFVQSGGKAHASFCCPRPSTASELDASSVDNVVAHLAHLLANKSEAGLMSRAADGSAVGESPVAQLIMEEAVKVWDGLNGKSEGEVLAAVKGDSAKCALALLGCLQHVIRSALGRALEQESAGVGVETLVSKCYGPNVWQRLHAHGSSICTVSGAAVSGEVNRYLTQNDLTVAELASQPDHVWGVLSAASVAAATAVVPLEVHADKVDTEVGVHDDPDDLDAQHYQVVVRAALGFINAAGIAALPHQQLDIIVKVGATTANVLQAGSHHKPVCVQHSCLGLGVMDLVATGACCDASIPPAQGTSLTKAHHRWHHCHGGLDNQGNLQGTGCPSVSFLLRVRHGGLPTDIVDAFPACVREVLGFENLGACLESLLHACGECCPVTAAEQIVQPADTAPEYSMAAAHQLKARVAPAVHRKVVATLTGLTVNRKQMADPLLGSCVLDFVVKYPELFGMDEGGESLTTHTHDLDGFYEAVQRMTARARVVKDMKSLHTSARPTLPWPGGWPTTALIALVSEDDASLQRFFALLNADACSKHHVPFLKKRIHVLSIMRKEFARLKQQVVASNASSTPHMLFAVAQTMAASVFYALHDENFWNACIATDHQAGIAFADKDEVIRALAAFGKRVTLTHRAAAGGKQKLLTECTCSPAACLGVTPSVAHYWASNFADTADIIVNACH